MKKMFKNKMMGWILAVVMLLFFSGHGQAWIKLNWVENSFDEDVQEDVEELVITGASGFMQSYSRLLEIFWELEQQRLQPANIPLLLNRLNESFQGMEKARAAYLNLYQKALNMPLNSAAIGQVMAMDYSAFQAGHNPVSKPETYVIDCLKQGDVREVIRSVWLESEEILDDLTFFRHCLRNGSVPEVEFLWKLNRTFSDSLQAGQQVARIFHEVAGK